MGRQITPIVWVSQVCNSVADIAVQTPARYAGLGDEPRRLISLNVSLRKTKGLGR